MAKRRKTRRQKIVAEQKRQHVVSEQQVADNPGNSTATYTFSSSSLTNTKQPSSQKNASQTDQHHYTYVKNDLIKTSFVTLTILVLQVVLFFAIR